MERLTNSGTKEAKPDVTIREALTKLAGYEDLQEKLDKQFDGCLSMEDFIEPIIEFDNQRSRNEKLAKAMLITNDSVSKYIKWKSLSKQGRLLEVPCNVGDTVYVKMQFGGYAEAEVGGFTYFLTCGFCIVVTSKSFDKQNIPLSEFGKTVFLTKEEAEAALKELERGKVE